MIHKILINEKTDLKELKKLFRKKLMTGGAVIRLEEGLNESQLISIYETFSIETEPNNVQSMVLRELAKESALPRQIRTKLLSEKDPKVRSEASV